LQAEWREGKDDDLVLAVAVGCWQAARLPLTLWAPPCAVTARRDPLVGPLYVPGEGRRWRA
jgi:hypothetical protein